jgi:uncharacterized protein (TIGR02099 family)
VLLKSLHYLKNTVLVLFLLLGMLVAVLRFGLPVFTQYESEVNSWLSDLVGLPIHIRKLQVSWYGQSPQLRLVDVEVLDEKGEAAMAFHQIRIELDIMASLNSGVPKTGLIQVVGASIAIEQLANGEIRIDGLPESAGQDNAEFDQEWLDSLEQVAILDSTLSIRKGDLQFEYSHLNLVLSNYDKLHVVEGSALLKGADQNHLSFKSEWVGPLLHPEQAMGKIYLHAENFAVESLPIPVHYQNLAIEKGTLDLQLWSRWNGVHLSLLTGDVELKDVLVVGQKKLNIHGFKSHFDWRRAKNKKILNFENAQLLLEPNAKPLTVDFALERTIGSKQGVMIFNIAALNFSEIKLWSELVDKEGKLSRLLKQINPRGQIEHIKVFSPIDRDGPIKFTASGGIKQLNTRSYGELIPGVENVDIQFEMDELQGVVHFQTEYSELIFKTLFRDPLQIDKAQGAIAWRNDGNQWIFKGDDIAIDFVDIETRSRIEYRVDGRSDPFIDLQTSFKNGKMVNASRYYPAAIMDAELVEWLDKAFIKGTVTDGMAVIRGQQDDIPFENKKGKFEVSFRTQGVMLNYEKGWPKLHGLAADVRFFEDSMSIVTHKGGVYGATILPTTIDIETLSESSPLLVQGKIKGDLSESLLFVRNSPLWEDLKGWLEPLNGTGNHTLAIDLNIPMDDAETKVKGDIQFENARISSPDQFELSHVNGHLYFSESTVSAKRIFADVFDMASVISIDHLQGAGAMSAATLISVDGVLNSERLPEGSLLSSVVQGETKWQANLIIPEQKNDKFPVKLEVKSQLKGLAVNLPSPLDKAAQTSQKFSVSTSLDTSIQIARFQYGTIVNGVLETAEFKKQRAIRKGHIHFGSEKAALALPKGILVSGGIKRLYLPEWRDWLVNNIDSTQVSDSIPLSTVQLSFEQLGILGGQYKKVDVTLNRLARDWEGSMFCAGAEGDFTIPKNLKGNRPVKLRFKKVHVWHDLTEEGSVEEEEKSFDLPLPSTLPPIHADIESLIYNGEDVGKLTLRTQKQKVGLLLNELSLQSKNIDFKATGSWVENPVQKSDIKFHFNTPNISRVMSKLGFSETLKGGKLSAASSLNWLGTPMDLGWEKLLGKVDLVVTDGRFLDIEPGVGRAFGLLSLETITRRLTLDFSDLVKKGFAFDSIMGQLSFEDGNLYTSNLMMKGPAANVSILGDTNLITKEYDQLVTVVPKLTSSLPLAVTIANPVAGLGVFVAQQVVGDEIDKTVKIMYAVEGTWDQPKVTKMDQPPLEREGLLKRLLPDFKFDEMKDDVLLEDEF